MQEDIYQVPIEGFIYVGAKDEAEALKVARNWTHMVVTEVEGGEPYNYDLSLVKALHIETDENHVFYVSRYFADEMAKAKRYWLAKVAPSLPKKLRDRVKLDKDKQ